MSATAPASGSSTVVEVRLLDGPNLYFPRAAAKVTLDVSVLAGGGTGDLRRVGEAAGMRGPRPGAPGSAQRQAFLLRLLRRFAKDLAHRAGPVRLAVRVRVGPAPHQVVVAFPWRSADRAEAFGEALGTVVDRCTEPDLAAVLAAAAVPVAAAREGRGPAAVRAAVPVVSVTGTNGKTTTTRIVAHLCMTAGYRTGWSSTDGVVVQGEVVEPGDYSGPAGGRAVLSAPGVQVAVLETARGGLLLRGLGVVANDVSVVTNVSADHLGLQGVDTVDQLAEVKAIVTRVTRPDGWTVLNGDDPRVLAMRAGSPGRPFVFSLDPASPALREALDHGGRAVTVMDGAVTVLTPGQDPDELVPVVDVPVTLAGLSEHNTANALAATAAGLGLGLPRDAVVRGLRGFRPDPALNPGRLNVWSLPVREGPAKERTEPATFVVDAAHNEAGLDALLRVARGLVAPGGRVLLGLGTAGDRTDEILHGMGELAGVGADRVVVVHKERYLRGRSTADLEAQLRRGLAAVGVTDVPTTPDELAGARRLLDEAAAGDVVALMVAADRPGVEHWLRSVGATVDGPDDVRAKVLAARGEHRLEREIAALWGLPDDDARIARCSAWVAAAPSDARLLAELGGAYDSAGREAEAEPPYRRALDLGLGEPHRSQVRVQLASTLRNLGRAEEALAELDGLLAERPGSTAATAFRTLVLHDLGRHAEALSSALGELTAHLGGTDAAPYVRALRAYADELT